MPILLPVLSMNVYSLSTFYTNLIHNGDAEHYCSGKLFLYVKRNVQTSNLDYLGLISCFISQGEQNNHTA
jgi:hypothetical protein